jgi:hypothetical protein
MSLMSHFFFFWPQREVRTGAESERNHEILDIIRLVPLVLILLICTSLESKGVCTKEESLPQLDFNSVLGSTAANPGGRAV